MNHLFLREKYAGPNEFNARTVCLKKPKEPLKAVNMNGQKKRTTRLTMIETPLKTNDELNCYVIVSRFCTKSGIRHVTFVTNPLIRYEPG